MKKLIVSFVVLIANSCFVLAQEPGVVISNQPGWHKIGEVKADFKTESESIAVIGNDKFKSIKLKVTDAPIDLNKVVVYYEDDKMEEIPVSGPIAAGNESKTYDLEYPTADIKKVVFTYKSQPNYRGEKAHIELYGFK
jgi:hypothetical protein